MARSPLFGRLQQIARRAGASRATQTSFSRRDLLRASVFAGAGVAVSRLSSACATEEPPRRLPKVAVIGAGIAGLHCAYRLQQTGLDVTVYEASTRVGGRIYTLRRRFPDQQVVEMGGELIDTNHRFMHGLVEELGLTLDDRTADAPAGQVVDTWFVNGAAVSEATIVEQFTEVAPAMLADMEAADSDDTSYETLDNTPLSEWLDDRAPVAMYPELHAVLTAAYRGEFGLECAEQSALNLIYLIGSDEPDPFRIFGESDERYHVRGGNDLITSALAEALGDRVRTERMLVAVQDDGDGYALTLRDENGEDELVGCDRLVLALPFSVLREVDLTALTLSDDKRTVIDELGYGNNTKVMAAFSRRVWQLDHNASGASTTDLSYQQTWDTSIGQDGAHGILTNFLGGDRALEAGAGTAEAWIQSVLPDMDRVFPGVADAYVADSAVRMHWPTYPLTKGSYTCYRPGQWAFWGTEGLREGNVHFCGEHTSPEFQGWMEGAAETGGRVAMEILDDLGIALPAGLAALIDDDVAPGESALLASRRFPKRFMRMRAKRAA